MARISFKATGDLRCTSSSRLSAPTPCSAEIEPPTAHTARTAESAFVETELRLPWGLLLTDRGVYYYSRSSRRDGWENRVELTKKFTETLSTAIRHELRRGSPDGRAQDYDRLKLLLGLDF